MLVSKVHEYFIDDIPPDVAAAAVRLKVPVTCRRVWDCGAYRLRIVIDPEDILPEVEEDAEVEKNEDFGTLTAEEFDDYFNWTGLGTENDISRELLWDFITCQRQLYPDLQLRIDQGADCGD